MIKFTSFSACRVSYPQVFRMCSRQSVLITVLIMTHRKRVCFSWRCFFLLRALELLVYYENASGRDKVHSLQPQRCKVLHFDRFVNVAGLPFLPCLTPGRTGVHSREGSLKLMGFMGLAKRCINIASTAPPERGTKTVFSKSVLVPMVLPFE